MTTMIDEMQQVDWARHPKAGELRFLGLLNHILKAKAIRFDVANVGRHLSELGQAGRGFFLTEVQNPKPPVGATWMETTAGIPKSISLDGKATPIDAMGAIFSCLPLAGNRHEVFADLFFSAGDSILLVAMLGYELPASGGTAEHMRVTFPTQIDDGKDDACAIESMNYFGVFLMSLSILNRPGTRVRRLDEVDGQPPMNEIVFDARVVGQRTDAN
jgi:hypothetical protein